MQFKLETNQTQTQVLEDRPLIFYIMDVSEKSHFPLFCFEEPFKHFSSTRVASLFTWISHRGRTQTRHPAGRSAVCLCCLRWIFCWNNSALSANRVKVEGQGASEQFKEGGKTHEPKSSTTTTTTFVFVFGQNSDSE